MASSSTLCPVSPSQLCSSNNELYSPSQALVRTHMVWKKDKKRIRRVRCTCMDTSAIPDMGKRQFMNMLLLDAMAGSILDKYVKRKKLEPLEAYVPAVILTQLQIQDLGKTLEINQPQYTSCRNLLRSGPAASLRINIRAVAQYASDSGNGKIAGQNVDQCLRALEELDSLFLHASRNDPEASVESMKAKISIALDALDGLLETVPSDVLAKGKAIADAYRVPEEDIAPENLDPEMKQLESIL
ncbi:hypothetical protein HYC85_014362 [Camellia sinensis]|uniref:DUF7880 domain-containing protein n=1 Tax=Camellia sinensis TaxID=4442 RepID=A0A7J7H7A0_CAMSI|nr:hypothetical protein HYC85_014362 [Camellia sinensis]